MESNKYYTPSIEEFHVGFEFETNYLQKDWIHKILTFDDFGFYTSTYEVDSCKTEFRIKYLDREDIESLGWTLDKVHEGKDQELFFKDNIIIYYRYNTHKLGIITRDPSKNDYYSKYNKDPYSIHSITIKNKSELKKLLKQLDIE